MPDGYLMWQATTPILKVKALLKLIVIKSGKAKGIGPVQAVRESGFDRGIVEKNLWSEQA